jgi:glycosyltransferase involved in cell wall biosynthesis
MISNTRDGATEAPARRIGMITYSAYESDNRVMRYAEALAARGDQVDVFALRKSSGTCRQECINGVNVYRIQDRFAKGERSKIDFLVRLVRFLFAAAWRIWREGARQPYHLIHVHNMPDFLVFAAAPAKWRGAQVILDIHDIVPEFFASKFKETHEGVFVRALRHVERWSAAFADHIIISNHLWRDRYAVRTSSNGKCSVYINHVDSRVFQPWDGERTDGKLIVLFPGGLYWHQGVDIAIRAFALVKRNVPNAEFHIYGDGDAKSELMDLCRELGLTECVRFFHPLSAREIARLMAEADLGVVPKRADSFGNEAYSTKIMEFMSVGVPVVISETKIDRYYFDDTVVRFFPSGDVDALAREMTTLLKDASAREQLAVRARDYAICNSWERRKDDYLSLVDTLCDGRSAAPTALGNPASSFTSV